MKDHQTRPTLVVGQKPNGKSRMKPRWNILILSQMILTAGLGVWAVAFGFGPREPVYQGKPLGAWLAGFNSGDTDRRAAATEALRAIGSNAVPFLVHMMRREVWNQYVKERLPEEVMHLHVRSDTLRPRDNLPFIPALQAVGEPGIPGLLKVFEQSSNEEVLVMTIDAIARIEGDAFGQFMEEARNRMPEAAWKKMDHALKDLQARLDF